MFPDGPLPMLSTDAEGAVRDCLVDCTIAVHLLGQHYGTTPEDSAESLPALQLRLTSTQAQHQDLQRLVWMPGSDDIVDERQRSFIAQVHEDAALADAWATALLVLGLERGRELAEAEGIGAFFITRTGDDTFAAEATRQFPDVQLPSTRITDL